MVDRCNVNIELKKYFEPDTKATYITKEGKRRLLAAEDKIRVDAAIEQYKKSPVKISEIISYVNEFLNMVSSNDITNKPKLDSIKLDGNSHPVRGRAIIINNCKWQAPVYDVNKRQYTSWDKKYDEIKEQFELNYANDVIWLKYTDDGYLGVVADSFDINFRYNNSSGKLIRVMDESKKWNESFVIVFPMTKDLSVDISRKISRKMIETAIRNYLLKAKKVPIIDCFSHNNFI